MLFRTIYLDSARTKTLQIVIDILLINSQIHQLQIEILRLIQYEK